MKRMFRFLLLVGLYGYSSQSSALAQDKQFIDSLKNILTTTTCDTTKILTYYKWGDLYWYSNPDSSKKYFLKSMELSEMLLGEEKDSSMRLFLKKELATILSDIGLIHHNKGEVQEALAYYKKSMLIREEINEVKGLAQSYSNLGRLFYNQGDIVKALEYFKKSLKIREEFGDLIGVSQIFNNLGSVYYTQGDYSKAFEYYQKTIKTREELGDQKGMAPVLNNLGTIHVRLAEVAKSSGKVQQSDSLLNEAVNYYQKSLEIRMTFDDKRGIAIVYTNLGDIFLAKEKLNQAEEYYRKAVELQKEIGDNVRLAISYINLGSISQKRGKAIEFEKYAKSAYDLSKKIGFPEIVERSAALMCALSVEQGNFKDAYVFLKEEQMMHDSVQNEENFKETQKQQARYEYEKRTVIDSIEFAKTIEIKNIDIARVEQQKKVQTIQRNSLFVILIFSLLFVFYVYRNYHQKKLANTALLLKNAEILQQKEEIQAQSDEIEAQRDFVSNQKQVLESINQKISQSIDYACIIQSSILPDPEMLIGKLSEHFVFFRPKDVVSGDFYWWANVDQKTVITAADCTGHGVPGAFMSMLGISFLQEIVVKDQITQPDIILNRLRDEIIRSLRQKAAVGEPRDGMEMAIITLDHQKKTVQYAGALNSLYVISEAAPLEKEHIREFTIENTNMKLFEIRPDTMPIAVNYKMRPFVVHEFEMKKGDQFYLFSDGFADQFGGKEKKKFLYSNFKQLFLTNAHKPMLVQKEFLEEAFDSWKGNHEQIDDVVVIGVKV